MAAAVRPSTPARLPASLKYLEGANSQSSASWFHPERLYDPDFSVDAYVAELRQSAPLEALNDELDRLLATLKGKLVEVINEDYNDFVSLSTKLVNVDGAVLRMQKPLQEVGEKLQAVKSSLQQEYNALGEGLALRQETASARGLLELMQDTAHTMSKVETLLTEIEGTGEGFGDMSGEALDSRCRTLERLASEVSRLSYYAAKGKDLPFVQQLELPMKAAREKLQVCLANALKLALRDSHVSARQHCLLAFAAISDVSGAEKVVQEVVVQPMLRRILDVECSPQNKAADAFARVLDRVLGEVSSNIGPLLEITSGSESSLQSFNFLGNSLLSEVDEAIAENMPAAVSPGVPATFLNNYKTAVQFLASLEKHCSTLPTVSAFRSCRAYDNFMKRWKLSIYFSTRFQEIAGAFETSLSTDLEVDLEGDSKSELALQLSPSQALVACLQRSLSLEVFLKPLADKFFRLLLQLLARYASWFKLGTTEADSAAPSAQAGPSDQQVQPGWGNHTPLELLASAISDVHLLGPWLQMFSIERVQQELDFLPPQLLESMRVALAGAIGQVQREAQPAAAAIVKELSDRCSSGLSQLRGITAMYRMSARPAPTRASHYVGGILATLKQFLELKNVQPLDATARVQVAEGVVSEVADRFRRMATELLETLRKTESSLKRIRQNRVSDSGGGGGPSDIDKISLQLFLDVQEFGRQALKYNVLAETLPAYQELWRCVAPPEQADSISLS